jgi:hypothetical protein
MNGAGESHDEVLAALGALAPCDLPAARAEVVRRQAHGILARRRQRARWGVPAVATLGRVAEPVFAAGLGGGFFLWLVARCLQIYGLLPA